MPDNQDEKSKIESGIINVFTTAFKEVGLAGFIVIFLAIIFIWYASEDQKREFIDRFLLLKKINSDPFPYIFGIIILVMALIGTNYYNLKERRRLTKEIDRISQEKSVLQEVLLKKSLESSK